MSHPTTFLIIGFMFGAFCMFALAYAARQFKSRRSRRLFVIGSLVAVIVVILLLAPRVSL